MSQGAHLFGTFIVLVSILLIINGLRTDSHHHRKGVLPHRGDHHASLREDHADCHQNSLEFDYVEYLSWFILIVVLLSFAYSSHGYYRNVYGAG